MKRKIKLTVNNEPVELEVSPEMTLVECIRNELHLTGTKLGCGNGECGACTIVMDNLPVRSCLILAIETDGAKITTIEGLSQGTELNPIQKAFIQEDAIQCGYCSPGFILAAHALLQREPQPTSEQIHDALGGHLCRCTGYEPIFRAVKRAGAQLRQPSPESQPPAENGSD